MKNRQRAIFRQQRHFQTQDSDVSDACYDGGNGRVKQAETINDEITVATSDRKIRHFSQKRRQKKNFEFSNNRFPKVGAIPSEKGRRIITNSQINHKSEDILIFGPRKQNQSNIANQAFKSCIFSLSIRKSCVLRIVIIILSSVKIRKKRSEYV